MQAIDIYEMIEAQLAQPPYNLPESDGRRQELVYDLVAHIPVHIFAAALRNIAEDTGLRMDDDYDDYDDSMDGDFDSAMASAGFGMDEDYGCYGEW